MDTKEKFNHNIISVEDIELQEDSSVLIVGMRRMGKLILAINLIKFITDKFNDTHEVENNQAFSYVVFIRNEQMRRYKKQLNIKNNKNKKVNVKILQLCQMIQTQKRNLNNQIDYIKQQDIQKLQLLLQFNLLNMLFQILLNQIQIFQYFLNKMIQDQKLIFECFIRIIFKDINKVYTIKHKNNQKIFLKIIHSFMIVQIKFLIMEKKHQNYLDLTQLGHMMKCNKMKNFNIIQNQLFVKVVIYQVQNKFYL